MTKKPAKKSNVLKYGMEETEQGRGRWITMSNALARAGHGLTLGEKRLVMMAVSKLDSAKYQRYGFEPPGSKITAAEYAECYDVDLNTAYEQLQNGTKNLYNRSISFFKEAHNRKGEPIEPTKVKMRWVGQIHYQKKEGWVELFWWPKVVPHLFDLKKQFTSYQLKQVSALRCQYSWRLLELLTRFKSSGIAKYSIEDFCVSMDATEKQKANFAYIRRRMIEPAVKELTEKDNWIIEWKPIKAGRKVKELQFAFEKNPQTSLFEKF